MFPLIFLLLAFSLIAFLMYKVLTKEPLIEKIVQNPDQFIPMEIIDFRAEIYQNLKLLNAYYSLVNSSDFDLNIIHSIDQGVFLEFEGHLWLNVMFNSELGIFEITNVDPFSLELDYELVKLNDHEKWQPFINQKMISINLELEKIDTIVLPENLNLKFANEQISICCTNEISELPDKLEFGVDWLALVFTQKTFIELRKA